MFHRPAPIAILLALVSVACDDSAPREPADEEAVVEPAQPAEEDPEPVASLRCGYTGDAAILDHSDVGDPGPFQVTTRQMVFVDESRPTPPNGDYAGSDSRRLPTTIWAPADGPSLLFRPSQAGPFPLVVYSHGSSSLSQEAGALAQHLASHGYVVIAPTYPLSRLLAPGGSTILDVVNQPGDVSFLIDQVLALSAQQGDPLFGVIDGERIAAAGLSLGGLTTSLVTFHRELLDERIDAAVTLAGLNYVFSESFFAHNPRPLLMVHGDIDAFVNYQQNALTGLERAAPNANLVTLIGGTHAGYVSFIQMLTDLLGSFVAIEGADPSNPDGIGCGFVGGGEGGGPTSAMGALLGDPDNGILPVEAIDDMLLPCRYGMYDQPALDPEVQGEYTQRAVLSFLSAHLSAEPAERESHCRYLNERLAEPEEVVFE